MKLIPKILLGLLAVVVISVSALALTIGYTSSCEPAVASSENSNSMQAVIYRCYGGPEVLERVSIEIPEPAAHQVLVRVKAAAVNPLDWHFMRGSPYFMRLLTGIGKPDDQRLGVDFAGVVEKVGSEVNHFKPGDEVFGGGTGAYADYVLATADKSLVMKPANVSFEQAASLPIAALTALQALRNMGKLEAGEKVLINGASGGVGTLAVQIAKSFGAEVHGVCSTRNVEMVKSIGATHVYDYKTEDYTESGEQYDLIVDMIGNKPISANVDVLKETGRLVIVGGPKGNWIGPMLPALKALFVSNFVEQEIVGFTSEFNQKDLQTLADLMQNGELSAVIDQIYSLDEIHQAMQHSESGRARGKIIVRIN